MLINDLKLEDINSKLEQSAPQDILIWAWHYFSPHIAATSSFQTQSLPLLHMISMNVPELDVIFIDTGFHFPETLAYRDKLMTEFGLRVRLLSPTLDHTNFVHKYGDLYLHDPDLCCKLNKVDPFRLAKHELKAWITGIRRDQTTNRSTTQVISHDKDGTYKICPILNWTGKDIWEYIGLYNLPVHPLLEKGYQSIGCAPCTQVNTCKSNDRAGRWVGQRKIECGLHIDIHQR